MLGLGGNGEQNARADAENEKGSGTPTTGRIPLTMPMLTKVYVKKMQPMAPARRREKRVSAKAAM